MRLEAALTFTFGAFLGTMSSAAWYAYRHGGDWGELGWQGAAVGAAWFASCFFAIIFSYGAISRLVHRDHDRVSRKLFSIIAGYLQGVVFWPLGGYITEQPGAPAWSWVIAAVVVSAVAFELIRFGERTRSAQQRNR